MFDQLDVVYTGPDRSFIYYAIRAFNVNQLDVIYIGSDRLFTASSGLLMFDQLYVIYIGSDRSFTTSSGLLS